MTSVRVVLVDDNALFMASAVDFLSRDPRVHVVGCAIDGEEGLRLAERLGPDIMFIDLRMPRTDGLEVARRLRAGVNIPRIFIVSMHAGDGIARDARRAGADGFIPKAQFADRALEAIDAFCLPSHGSPPP